MGKFIDLTGREFGRLKVVKYSGNRKWLCECSCGNFKNIQGFNLRSGQTQSCGCLANENASKRCKERKGQTRKDAEKSKTRRKTYAAWYDMILRCINPTHDEYHNYGGRGIKVCPEWLESFENFLRDVGESPSDKTLDRINMNGGYEPKNVRWATVSEQNKNKRTNRVLKFEGQALCLTDWAKLKGIRRSTLDNRLKKGWSIEKALTTPVFSKKEVGAISAEKRLRIGSSLDRLITFQGETKRLTDWARYFGIKPVTVGTRLSRGWSVQDALTTPPTPKTAPRKNRR